MRANCKHGSLRSVLRSVIKRKNLGVQMKVLQSGTFWVGEFMITVRRAAYEDGTPGNAYFLSIDVGTNGETRKICASGDSLPNAILALQDRAEGICFGLSMARDTIANELGWSDHHKNIHHAIMDWRGLIMLLIERRSVAAQAELALELVVNHAQ